RSPSKVRTFARAALSSLSVRSFSFSARSRAANVLSVLGGLLGLLAGLVSSALVENLFQMPTKLSPEIFAIGGIFSAGIGILFGYYPAHKASQLDPIQSLRYE